jgi:hypothetical protein
LLLHYDNTDTNTDIHYSSLYLRAQKVKMSHAHQQGRTLQWMRSAPKDAAKNSHNYNEADASSSNFLQTSTHHFQVLDDHGLAIEQQRIDDAARRVLSRRRKGPLKAWGAPASTEEDYRRSLMPRSPKARGEHKARSPKRRGLSKEDSDALNYAFMPESERLAATRPKTAGAERKRNDSSRASKKGNSGLEEIPSDFVDKLHIMRNNSAVQEKKLEEKYEEERDAPVHNRNKKQERGSPVKSWTNAVREAFVEDCSSSEQKSNKRSSAPARKKPTTVPQPFAGVEARSTIKTVSRSMERVLADLAERKEKEKEALKYKWHAKPVPRACKENRYQALLDKAEATRIKESAARKERLNETLQPFPGLERREREGKLKKLLREEKRQADIAAQKAEAKRKKERSQRRFRQAAAKSAAAENDRGSAEVERRARIQRRASKLLHSSKMPARMEMWEKTKKQNAQDDDNDKPTAKSMKLNKISSMDSGDIRKYFQRSQLKFKKSLQQARQSRPKAASRPFAFMSEERKMQEEQRKKKTEERLQRVEEKRILEKTKKERRQKELAKKLKGMKHVSICFCFCFWECVRMCRNVFSNTIVFFIYKYCSPFHAKQQKQKKHKKR